MQIIGLFVTRGLATRPVRSTGKVTTKRENEREIQTVTTYGHRSLRHSLMLFPPFEKGFPPRSGRFLAALVAEEQALPRVSFVL